MNLCYTLGDLWHKGYLLRLLFLLLFITSLLFAGDKKVLLEIDFTKHTTDDAIALLASKGFEFLLDVDKIDFKLSNNGLEFETEKKAAVLFGIHLKNPIANVTWVSIEWGVERFPKNANWEEGNNRVALGAILVFGEEKFASGLPIIAPRAPYFFGPFIGEHEKVGKLYLGKLYKKAGRYYCVSNKKGLVHTEFDAEKRFYENFDKPIPPLVAFAFQMNTKNTQGGAKAFIKKIVFYGK